MDDQLDFQPDARPAKISSMPEMEQYLGLIGQSINLCNHILMHRSVLEQEETARLNIRRQAEKDLEEITRKLDLLDRDLMADINRLKKFVDDSMDEIKELIRLGQYEIADKFHERVSKNLEGRASNIADKFNKMNSNNSIYLLEEDN